MNQPPPTWVCSRCGFANHLAADACQQCQQPTTPAVPLPPTPRPQIKDTSNTKALLLVAGSFIGLCAMCGFLSLLANRSSQKSKSSSSLAIAKTSKTSGATPKSKATTTASRATTEEKPEEEKPELEVIEADWEKGELGTAAVWQVTFRNNTERKISDIKYEIRYYAETGKQVARDEKLGVTEHTSQKVMAPKKMQSLEINDGLPHKDASSAVFTLKSWRVLD